MVLLGIVPVLMAAPPTTSSFSMIAVRLPNFAAWIAARCPAGPEPTTMTSYLSISRAGSIPLLDFFVVWRMEARQFMWKRNFFRLFFAHLVRFFIDARSALCHDSKNYCASYRSNRSD